MGLKYTKRAMTSYEVHRFFHGLEISFFPDTFLVCAEIIEMGQVLNEILIVTFFFSRSYIYA